MVVSILSYVLLSEIRAIKNKTTFLIVNYNTKSILTRILFRVRIIRHSTGLHPASHEPVSIQTGCKRTAVNDWSPRYRRRKDKSR